MSTPPPHTPSIAPPQTCHITSEKWRSNMHIMFLRGVNDRDKGGKCGEEGWGLKIDNIDPFFSVCHHYFTLLFLLPRVEFTVDFNMTCPQRRTNRGSWWKSKFFVFIGETFVLSVIIWTSMDLWEFWKLMLSPLHLTTTKTNDWIIKYMIFSSFLIVLYLEIVWWVSNLNSFHITCFISEIFEKNTKFYPF